MGKFVGDDFGDGAAEMSGDGEVVDLGETFVEADEAQVAIEEARDQRGHRRRLR